MAIAAIYGHRINREGIGTSAELLTISLPRCCYGILGWFRITERPAIPEAQRAAEYMLCLAIATTAA